ncbi:MAG TPA: CPBP family intramembrane glutamic endopeptidase, partial [Stellaceae bacterium]|nr:CPBP family intramembrane glutamic endopeptidase [Stellaceae bacterium]
YAFTLLQVALYPTVVAGVIGATMGLARPSEPVGRLLEVLLQFGPIVVAGIVLVWGVRRFHRRPWRSLIAPDLRIDGRRLAIGGITQLAILGGQLALVHFLTGLPWTFSVAAALPVFALALVLIPLQAASEELLFRGYLTQALGRIVRSRIAIAAIAALVFGLLHLSVRGPLTVPYFFVLSLVFSLVSLRDERLELTIGGHAAMNLFAVFAAHSGIVQAAVGGGAGPAMFNAASIAAVLVNGALFYGITRLLVRLCCEPRLTEGPPSG